jgi:L-threonylcarbamoyladenylate synthase
MKTLTLGDTESHEEQLAEAARSLERGKVIVCPTDTVYGLGADATNPEAVAHVRALKGSDTDKPILALVDSMNMLKTYAHVTPLAEALAEQFLPGPLALVLETSTDDLHALTAPDGSVGFRMPDHTCSLSLATKLGRPITSTSVNKSGEPQPLTLDDMIGMLDERALEHLEVVLDDGALEESTPSTVVDARGEKAVILREGAILRGALAAFL